MIKNNQHFLRNLQICLDGIVVIFSYLLAWYLKFQSGLFVIDKNPIQFETYLIAVACAVCTYIIINAALHLYTADRIFGIKNEYGKLLRSNLLMLLIILTALFILKQQHFSRTMIFIFFGLNFINSLFARIIIYAILNSIRKNGMYSKHILLIGYSRAAEEYIDRLIYYKEWGYRIYGILDDNVLVGTSYNSIPVIGKIKDLNKYLKENELDEIAITLQLSEYAKLGDIANLCEKSGVHTQFVPDYNYIIPTKPYTEDFMGLPVINIRHVPLAATFNACQKRIFDFVISIVAIIISLPLLLIISIIIKLTSKGALIFKQERVGLRNKKFMMYKFRTMMVQTKEQEEKEWTTKNDQRVTSFGKILRRTSLDELPQLFNIVKGDMSLIGPRPERPYFVDKFKEEIPRYMIKHQVRPGITGWAQVNGLRGDTSIQKRIEYDLYYIENWSIEFDLRIIFLTITKGFINKNAY